MSGILFRAIAGLGTATVCAYLFRRNEENAQERQGEPSMQTRPPSTAVFPPGYERSLTDFSSASSESTATTRRRNPDAITRGNIRMLRMISRYDPLQQGETSNSAYIDDNLNVIMRRPTPHNVQREPFRDTIDRLRTIGAGDGDERDSTIATGRSGQQHVGPRPRY